MLLTKNVIIRIIVYHQIKISSYPDVIFLFSRNIRIKRTGRYELVPSAVRPRRVSFPLVRINFLFV